MKQSFFDDHSHIAEQFMLGEEHLAQMSKLTYHKINSFKLSLSNQAFCMSKNDLGNLIKSTLLNYISPVLLLSHLGFFESEAGN
jgi:hypothetical protein